MPKKYIMTIMLTDNHPELDSITGLQEDVTYLLNDTGRLEVTNIELKEIP